MAKKMEVKKKWKSKKMNFNVLSIFGRFDYFSLQNLLHVHAYFLSIAKDSEVF